MDRTVNNVTQIISRPIKSDRQIKYSSTSSKSATFHETKETPFSVGLGLLMYKHTQSKKIINILSDMKLAINYDKILKIETNIAEYVVKTMEECDRVYVPPSLGKHSLVYFATDNCDFKNDTPDGKHEIHATVQIVYQNPVTPISHQPTEINRNQNKTLNLNPFPQTETIPKPIPPNKSYQAFNNSFHDIERYKNIDTLNICQNISTKVAPDNKTIISLDLQLYAKALQLQSRNDVANNFVFRPGELHIVFAFQHAIGKYIDSSGLDQALIDCDIYGPIAVSQILKGKHMKRGMEAYDSLSCFICCLPY